MCAICFLLLGTFIAYYKSVVKVETMIQQQKTTLYCYIAFAIIGVIHSSFVIFFAFNEEVISQDGSVYDKLGNKTIASEVVSVVVQIIFYFAELSAYIITYRKVQSSLKIMLQFHDYLIEYRLTPRSRILRKHLPKMTMVLEEDSNLDQSSIMMSQSRIMSVSQHTIKTSTQRKKFVYIDQEAGAKNTSMEDQDISDDSEDSDDENDLESDLIAFD